jgi:LPS sulfotransferase NodH
MSRDPRVVTLVTGTPRSGTSLLMQMLRAGGMPLLCDDARPADADNPRGYFESAAVRRTRQDASWLDGAAGRAVKVVHALVPSLPPQRAYRVIDVRRPLVEVLPSQRRMLLRAGEPAPVGDDASLGLLFQAQREAMERWVLRVAGAPLLRLEYPQVVADPAAAAARLADFVGADLDAGAMASAVEPRLYRERSARADVTPRATTRASGRDGRR